MDRHRSITDRCLSFSVGLFLAAFLIYTVVQLLLSVLWWLVGGAVVVAVLGVGLAVYRARRDRW